MCMNFYLSNKEVAALCALGVILSPVLLVGGVFYGGAHAVAAGVGAVQEHSAKKQNESRYVSAIAKAASSTEFQEVLQAAYDKALANPSFTAFAELAVALFAKRDYHGAHTFFVKAEQQLDKPGAAAVPAFERAIAAYLHGLTLQLTAHFTASIGYFDKAAALFPAGGAAAAPANAAAGATIDRNDALLQGAYSAYLSVMFVKHDDEAPQWDDETAIRRPRLEPALAKINEVVAAEPQNMRAKLVRAFIEFQLYLPDEQFQYQSEEEAPYHTAYILMAHSDCKEAFDWAHAATEEQLQAEGISTADTRSLMAHILLAMGEHNEARKLVSQPDPHGGEVFGAEGSQREAFTSLAANDPQMRRNFLCNPWPLPVSLVVDTSVQKHNFEKHFFKTPTYCDYCMTFISFAQNRSGAYRCTICKYEVHGECLAAAKENFCLATREVSEKTANVTHTHVFIEHRLHRVRDCVVCGDSIMIGTTGAQCSQCNQYCHKRCVEKADAVHSPKLKN